MTAAKGTWSPAEVNVLTDDKHRQVIALGQLGWSRRRIEEATTVRRETASAYLKAAGAVAEDAPAAKTGQSGGGVHRPWA